MVCTEFFAFATLVLALVGADTECPKNVELPRGTVVFPDKCTVGSVLRYRCPPRTRAAPVSWRVCGLDGSWSPIQQPVACVSYYCSGPITLENGWLSLRKAQYKVGDIVHFHCQPGYVLYGAPNITCLSSGKWTAPPAVCDSADSLCGNPGVPAGGQRVGHRFWKGSQVRYTCYRGLLMRGPKFRACQEDGTWSGTQPVCEGPHAYDDPHTIAESFSLSEHALMNPEQDLHLHFILKASRSVGTENMEKALDFMYWHANQVIDFSKKRKVELIIFGESAKRMNYDEVDLRDYEKFLGGSGVNTGEALQLVLSLIESNLNTSTGGLPAKNILILITDGRHNMGPSPTGVIQKMTKTIPNPEANLEIFVVGVGGATVRDSLEKIASQRSEPRAFYLPDYNDLNQIQAKVSEDTCGVRGQREIGIERIFGGKKATDHQWPWQAMLFYRGVFSGGGSIISRQWVLTAAHVLYDTRCPEDFTIVAGVQQRTIDKSSLLAMKVEKCFVHEDFIYAQFYNDIALLRLKEKLYFGSKIRPVCLPCTAGLTQVLSLPSQNWTSRCLYQDLILTGHGGEDYRTVSGFVTGWGLSGRRNILESQLKYGRISIKQREQCRNASEALTIALTDEKFCASGEGVDACRGDSGGPFIIKKNGRWIQIGIVSYGTSVHCTNGTMGIYTSVPRLMPWIKGIVGQDVNFA